MQKPNETTKPSHTFKNSLRGWQLKYLARKAEGKPVEERDQVAALAEALQLKPARTRRTTNRK